MANEKLKRQVITIGRIGVPGRARVRLAGGSIERGDDFTDRVFFLGGVGGSI